MNNHEHIVLGERDHWGQNLPFVLSLRDRRHHLYAIGKSGTGKTTLLRNLILQDIEAGHGVAVIDPHGDLANELLDYIPRRRIDDVIFFNPSDMEFPIGFNLLGYTPPDERHLVASGSVSVFKSIWSDSWGLRLEYILYATIAALLDCDDVIRAGIESGTSRRFSAWVLPGFSYGIPMESEFLQLFAYRFGWRDIEFEPDPVTNDLGVLENVWHFVAQPFEQGKGLIRTCIT